MVFSSLTFLLVFLPLLLLIYFIIPRKHRMARNLVLAAFSVLFYAWGEPLYVFLIIISIAITHWASKKIAGGVKWGMILAVAANLLPLVFFKYIDFIIVNLNLIPGVNLAETELPLPIGISFYTFQNLTYIIDLYMGRVKRQRNPFYLALYVFLFPQLVAGPIVRYASIEDAIENRRETMPEFMAGLTRFIRGLAKKVLIANQAGFVTATIMAQESGSIGTSMLWLAVFAYAIQIYFDFSGYSDMAIGLGRMVGFRFPENFHYPYASKSVTEFWRRWHISLTSFFRDYVYIPLGGNRVSKPRWIFNFSLVWLLTGIWHGAYWNFIFWGLFYCAVLLAERLWLYRLLEKVPRLLAWCYTFTVTLFAWAIFMTETNQPADLLHMLGRMISFEPTVATIRSLELQPYILFLILGFVLSFPIRRRIMQLRLFENRTLQIAVCDAGVVLLYLFCLIYIVADSFNPFIYFRF